MAVQLEMKRASEENKPRVVTGTVLTCFTQDIFPTVDAYEILPIKTFPRFEGFELLAYFEKGFYAIAIHSIFEIKHF